MTCNKLVNLRLFVSKISIGSANPNKYSLDELYTVPQE